MIDLRDGDWLRFRGPRYRIRKIAAYRENTLRDGEPSTPDGYIGPELAKLRRAAICLPECSGWLT